MQSKKLLFSLLIGLSLLGTLACGSVSDLVSQVQNAVTTDPAAANERGQAIANYTLPEGLSAQMAMGLLDMEMVLLADQPLNQDNSRPAVVVLLAKLPAEANFGEAELQRLRDTISQQTGQNISTDVAEVGTRDVIINGKTVTLSIREGQDQQGNGGRVIVGTFLAKDGNPAALMIAGAISTWPEAAVDAFLNSMS